MSPSMPPTNDELAELLGFLGSESSLPENIETFRLAAQRLRAGEKLREAVKRYFDWPLPADFHIDDADDDAKEVIAALQALEALGDG